MMVIGRFCVLFRHGPHGAALSPTEIVQRIHVARAEVQGETAVHAARNGRPTDSAEPHAGGRTIGTVAHARSGEVDRGDIAAVCPEVDLSPVVVNRVKALLAGRWKPTGLGS